MSSENLEIVYLSGALTESVLSGFDAAQKLLEKSDRLFAIL